MILSCAFVEIDGPDVYGVRKNPLYHTRSARRARAADDAEWHSERTHQGQMAFGISWDNS
jgi:hypothetical protein